MHFNPATNPFNIAIGDFNAAHIDLGFTLDYQLSRQFHLIGALTATHFSNGGTTKPNSGINQLGLMTMLRYDFEKEPLTFKQWQIAEYPKNWEWLISGSYCIRNRTNGIEVDVWVSDSRYYGKSIVIATAPCRSFLVPIPVCRDGN